MGNTIYYTLSTIAQVLSTIIGIIGAFAIFHIQTSDERLFGFAYNFFQTGFKHVLPDNYDYTHLFDQLNQAIDEKKVPEIESLMMKTEELFPKMEVEDTLKDINSIDILKLKILHQRFKQLSSDLENQKQAIRKIFIITLSIIIASLIVLSLTTLLCIGSAIVLLCIFLIAASICFFYVYKFITGTIFKL
ncbi:MAG: hypothetical protein PHP04_14515 [Bacteroidales bacterium]|nr:hypothetical protein [Bacteroidales bacterium]